MSGFVCLFVVFVLEMVMLFCPESPFSLAGLVGIAGHGCQAALWRGLVEGLASRPLCPQGVSGDRSASDTRATSSHSTLSQTNFEGLLSVLCPRERPPRKRCSLGCDLEVWESRWHCLARLVFAPLWLSAPHKHRASEKPEYFSQGQVPVSIGGRQVPSALGIGGGRTKGRA